jgi:RimJ/RimL family protein N-acetyltransferase
VPECEGQGIASEALGGLVAWAAASGRVTQMRATTFERHWSSIRVLEKNGFVCLGVNPDDAQAAESDRQGRGRLMIWRR